MIIVTPDDTLDRFYQDHEPPVEIWKHVDAYTFLGMRTHPNVRSLQDEALRKAHPDKREPSRADQLINKLEGKVNKPNKYLPQGVRFVFKPPRRIDVIADKIPLKMVQHEQFKNMSHWLAFPAGKGVLVDGLLQALKERMDEFKKLGIEREPVPHHALNPKATENAIKRSNALRRQAYDRPIATLERWLKDMDPKDPQHKVFTQRLEKFKKARARFED